MEHNRVLPECKEIFTRLEDKIDTIIEKEDRFNDKWDKHVEFSVKQRSEHETKINLLTWLFGALTLPVIFMLFKTLAR